MLDRLPISQLELLVAIDRAGVGHAITDRSGDIICTSGTFRQHTNLNEEEQRGTPWFLRDPAPKATHLQRERLWNIFLQENKRWQGLVRWHLKDGNIRYFEGTAVPVDDVHVVLITNDRTDRVEARQSLLEQEERQEQVMAALPLAVCLHGHDVTILYMNDYLPNRLGKSVEDFIGCDAADALGPELSALCDTMIADIKKSSQPVNGRPANIETGPMAGSHWLLFAKPIHSRDGTSVGILTIGIDRTDSARLRKERALFAEALHQNQKINALNDFAGNLAHELSNLLHPVGAYARMLANNPNHEDRAKFAAKINQGTLTAGRILRRTLAMAHLDSSEIQRTDIVETIDQTIASANDLAPSGLRYESETPEDIVMAWCQLGELRQVLLNLLNNAAEAMHYKGLIQVRIDQGLPRPTDIDFIPTGPPPFVRISVQDEGPGMSPETRARIFEPFFTTKPVGRGTGLGLAVVQGLVNGWGGVVSVETAQKKGTTFHVWIPQGNVEQ